jgi:SAM-dependent methyltransferase
MQYEPIKGILGRFFGRSVLLRRLLYFLLDILLLRSWHVRKALRRIAAGLPPDSSALDAGSGFGQYTWRMCRQNKGWRVTGIDINPSDVEQCRNFFAAAGLSGRTSFRTGDLAELSDKNLYNLIISIDVMEHIREDEKVFAGFYNALKDNGALLISTPSDKGGSDVHSEKESSFIDEHVRDGYGVEEITSKLEKAGFRDVAASYTYGKAGNVSWRLSMKIPVRLLNISYLFFVLLPFYYLVFFPISFILNVIDVNTRHRSGTGLLVTAWK